VTLKHFLRSASKRSRDIARGTKYFDIAEYTGEARGKNPILHKTRQILMVTRGLESNDPIFVFSDDIPILEAETSVVHINQGLPFAESNIFLTI
jgi:hypothetical protein